MTILDTRPVPDGRTKADPDECHLYCCSEDVSLCGLDISDANEREVPPDDDAVCLVCGALEDIPCGPGCPKRRPS